jgi:glutathione S-transferase
MQLYYSPMACSLATRISLYEAGADAEFVRIDGRTKQVRDDGRDYRTVNPLGLVPAIATDEGLVLTENAAILQHVADRFPSANLAPPSGFERSRLQQWLCFIGTELHKVVFAPLLDAKANEGARAYALEKAPERLSLLEVHLGGREFLLDHFTVADAYLFTVLGWAVVTPIDLSKYPAVSAYLGRLRERPSVRRAASEERDLYLAEQAQRKSA